MVVLLLAAVGFLLAAVYLKSAALWGSAAGALATALFASLLAGVFLWLTIRTSR